jgi:putative peptidoglycan lipid II flippase
VVAVGLLAYTMFSGGGSKGDSKAGATGTSASQATTSASSQAPASANLTATSVSIYDSDDGSEGKGYIVGNQISSKGWSTSQYCQDYATQHGSKKSTGLVFDLGSVKTVTSASVTIGTGGAAMEMLAADSTVASAPTPSGNTTPAGFTKVASADPGGTTVTLTANSPVSTRFVLIWFTSPLPASPTPDMGITCAHNDGKRYGDSIMSVKFNAS